MTSAVILDADAHVLEPPDLWERGIDRRWRDQAPRVVRKDEHTELLVIADEPISPYSISVLGSAGMESVDRYDGNRPGGFDPKLRLLDMDREGIDQVVLYPTLGLFMGGVQDAALAAAIARAYNDWLCQYCAAAPGRLFGAAMLPLQDIDLAVKELERVGSRPCIRAVFLRPNPYAGRGLQTRRYDPLWSACAHLDLAVAIHEGAVGNMETAGLDRFDNLFFRHIVAHTLEMQLAVLSIIGGGVPERFPTLRFAFLEAGGGWLPAWLDRMDDHYEGLFGRFVPWLPEKPSHYFTRQCYISFEPGERTLAFSAQLLGADRIIWGSDYPHADATYPGYMPALRETLSPLEAPERDLILHRNAAALYRVS